MSAATRRPALLLALLIGLALVRIETAILTEDGAQRDALSNLTLAHGLATTGRIVESGDERSMYREPLPIALYALQMRLDPRLDVLELETLATGGPEVRALRQQHHLWAALLLAGVALQAWRLAPERRRLATAALAVVAVHTMFVEVVAGLTLTELLGATAVIWAGLAAQRWATTRLPRDAAVLGAVIGVGALTKASLLYLGAVFLVVLATLLVLRARRDGMSAAEGASRPRRTLATLGLALVALAVVVLPWMVRNAITFDVWSISDRGGLSLWCRAVYVDATTAELRGSWYEFSPLPLRPVVGAIVGVSEEDLDGPLRRVNRFHPDEEVEQRSFYELARVDRFERTEAYLATGVPTRAQARVLADRDLMAASLTVLREDPWRYVVTTPMFLWRGIWVVKAAPLVPQVALGLLNPLGMLALLAAAATAVVRIRPARFAVVGLPFGVVAFNALLTWYEPRFTELALPTMLILLAVGAARLVDRRAAPRDQW